jgi:hypothetical protein
MFIAALNLALVFASFSIDHVLGRPAGNRFGFLTWMAIDPAGG